jgi:hypothetical protein
MTKHLTATAMLVGALAANIAFLGLGWTFDYPDVLHHPSADVLAAYRDHQGAVMGWFALLAFGAGLMAPMAIGVRHITTGRYAGPALVVGVLAALAQVAGLSRWLLVVPTLAWQAADPTRATEATDRFELVGAVLGTGLGEAVGYLLTGAWTLLVLTSLTRRPPRWFLALGGAAAALVLSGVLIPLQVPGTDLANLLGYVLWSVWLLAFAVIVWRPARGSARGMNSPRVGYGQV